MGELVAKVFGYGLIAVLIWLGVEILRQAIVAR
jgi:hypothetical protein